MKKLIVAALAIGVLTFLAANARAMTMTYHNRMLYEATLGASITDTYDAFPSGIHSKAVMDAFLGETTYESTFHNVPDDNHILTVSGTEAYCAGCNGTFRLTFTTTSVGSANGVFGAGFDVLFHGVASGQLPFSAFITFGDFSTKNIALQLGASFFGITNDTQSIRSIHVASNDQASKNGSIAIDNLTIGNRLSIPIPATLPLFLTGLAGLGVMRRRRKV